MECIILAGGLGTRLSSVISGVPKPLAPVLGKPFLSWLMDYWVDRGARHFILSVGFLAEKVVEAYRDNYRGVPISYSIETKPRGTGGGLLLAMKQLKFQYDSDFWVFNGDTYFPVEPELISRFHSAHKADWTIVLKQSPDALRYLAVTLDGGRITGFGADPESVRGEPWINGGIYLLSRRMLAGLPGCLSDEEKPASLEHEIFPILLNEKFKVYGYPSSALFIDIGVPSDYARAESLFRNACAPKMDVNN